MTRVRALEAVLRARGVRPGDRVAVLVDRSTELVVSLLGVLASGAAYVPLDPTYPAERLRHMTADAAVALVVSQRELGEAARAVDAPALWLDRGWADGEPTDQAAAGGVGPEPTDDAYVIYTSGSTGRPKGVRVGHRALVNLLWSMAHEPGFTEQDRMLAVTTVSFDIAGLELFLPLVTGGTRRGGASGRHPGRHRAAASAGRQRGHRHAGDAGDLADAGRRRVDRRARAAGLLRR